MVYKDLIQNIRASLDPKRTLWMAAGACPDGKVCNPFTSITNLEELLLFFADVVVMVVMPAVVVMLIYAGFLFVTAQGDTRKVDLSKSIFLWTVVGATIIIGARVIVNAVMNTASNILP